jgi:hypothetical protein
MDPGLDHKRDALRKRSYRRGARRGGDPTVTELRAISFGIGVLILLAAYAIFWR